MALTLQMEARSGFVENQEAQQRVREARCRLRGGKALEALQRSTLQSTSVSVTGKRKKGLGDIPRAVPLKHAIKKRDDTGCVFLSVCHEVLKRKRECVD